LSSTDGAVKRVSDDPNGYYGLSLTADSQTLVTAQGDELSNVWVATDRNPTRLQKITSGKYDGLALRWTPDDRIVYVSQESGNDDIWLMDSDGGNRKQLTTDPNVDVYPSVTADGKYIVFLSLRGGIPYIWRMNLDGSDQTRLLDGDGERHVECSSTGQWLIYLPVGHRGIWKVDIDGGKPVSLFDKFAFLPAISPDGTRVAFSYWEDAAKPEGLKQAVVSVDGKRRLQPLEIPKTAIGENSDVLLRWSPDGQAITYVDNRSGVSNIWSLPLAGGQPTQLTDFKEG